MRLAILGSLLVGHTAVFAEHLASAGYDVVVIGDGETAATGIRTVTVSPAVVSPSFRTLVPLWRRWRCIRRALRDSGCDVLNAHYVGTDAVLAVLATDTPMVLSFYGSDLHGLGGGPWYLRVAMRWLIGRAAAIHSVSSFMTAELLRYGAAEDKIETFQYGVDLNAFWLEMCRDCRESDSLSPGTQAAVSR